MLPRAVVAALLASSLGKRATETERPNVESALEMRSLLLFEKTVTRLSTPPGVSTRIPGSVSRTNDGTTIVTLCDAFTAPPPSPGDWAEAVSGVVVKRRARRVVAFERQERADTWTGVRKNDIIEKDAAEVGDRDLVTRKEALRGRNTSI
jgi:hypothetical protein